MQWNACTWRSEPKAPRKNRCCNAWREHGSRWASNSSACMRKSTRKSPNQASWIDCRRIPNQPTELHDTEGSNADRCVGGPAPVPGESHQLEGGRKDRQLAVVLFGDGEPRIRELDRGHRDDYQGRALLFARAGMDDRAVGTGFANAPHASPFAPHLVAATEPEHRVRSG